MSASAQREVDSAVRPDFMAGINVEGDDLRAFPEETVELLAPTPIRWIRVHLLSTRRLDDKGKDGRSYFDALEFLCKKGYNLIAPIDVGYSENVGLIPVGKVDAFVDDSYEFSLK